MGYCASFQSLTKHFPYFMLFQQNMRLPIDNDCLADNEEEEDEIQLDGLLKSLCIEGEGI